MVKGFCTFGKQVFIPLKSSHKDSIREIITLRQGEAFVENKPPCIRIPFPCVFSLEIAHETARLIDTHREPQGSKVVDRILSPTTERGRKQTYHPAFRRLMTSGPLGKTAACAP